MVPAPLLLATFLAQSLGAAPPPPTITNLGLAMPGVICQTQMRDDRLGERWIALQVSESAQGSTDLNGDGDKNDTVVFVHDRLLGTTTSTGLSISECILPFVHRSAVGVLVSESASGLDLSGDGDALDHVAHFYDAASGSLHNTRVVVPSGFSLNLHQTVDRFSLRPGGTVVIEMSEDGVVPLNADGDLEDAALDAWFLGSRSGVRPVQPASVRRSAAPLLATAFRGSGSSSFYVANESFLVMGVEEVHEGNRDLNGDGDAVDPDVLFLTDLRTGARRNLGIAGNAVQLSTEVVAFRAGEGLAGADLNGDGDLTDQVLHVYEPATGTLTNLGFAIGLGHRVIDEHVLALVCEAAQGSLDLNGDGDVNDQVAHVFAPGTWAGTNLGLAAQQTGGSKHKALFVVSESGQGSDLNGDGDQLDDVLHACHVASANVTNVGVAVSGAIFSGERFVHFYVFEIAQGSDFNLDGDTLDAVVGLYDGDNDTFHNTAIAAFQQTIPFPRVNASEGGVFLIAYEAGQGMDLNGDGDSADFVLAHWQSPGPFATNLGLAVRHEQALTVRGRAALFEVNETMQREDLNGDGDKQDDVAHLLVFP